MTGKDPKTACIRGQRVPHSDLLVDTKILASGKASPIRADESIASTVGVNPDTPLSVMMLSIFWTRLLSRT